MRNYRILSKIILAVYICGAILAIVNGFTSIINPVLSLRGNFFCVIGFAIAGGTTIILEREHRER